METTNTEKNPTAERVFNKLKHGYDLVCPECGNREFILETSIAIHDYAEFDDNGILTVLCEPEEDILNKTVSLSINDVDKVICARCDSEIPKKMLLAIPNDKIKYKS